MSVTKKSKMPKGEDVVEAAGTSLQKFWAGVRWLIEFGVPLYVLILVISITILSVSISGKSITLPVIGTIAINQLAAAAPASGQDKKSNSEKEIAVLTERIAAVQDSQKQTLTIIGGLAALFTFLGFRGYATIAAAHAEVKTAEYRAKVVQRRVKRFFDEDYSLNTKASLNITNGVIYRVSADVIAKALKGNSIDPCSDPDYIAFLDEGILYTKGAISDGNSLDPFVIKRAYGVLGNLYKRKGSYAEALDCSKYILRQDPQNAFANYNVSCYSSLVARQLNQQTQMAALTTHAKEAIDALQKACTIDQHLKAKAATDEDLEWLRVNKALEFASATQ